MNNSVSDSVASATLAAEGHRQFVNQAPLAAWSYWQRALRLEPDCQAALDGLKWLENSGNWPIVARTQPKFRNPVGEDRRARWDQALQGKDLAEIELASTVFETIAQEDPLDADAIFNQALCLAWQAKNIQAIEALGRFVTLTAENDFEVAADAWTLAELLRHAEDAAPVADDVSFAYFLNGPLMPDGLPGMVRAIEFGPTPGESAPGWPAGSRLFEWLTQMPVGTEPAVLLATFVVGPDSTRIFSPDAEVLPKAWGVLEQGRDLSAFSIEMRVSPLRIELSDMDVWTIRTDPDLDLELAAEIRRQHVERFYETRWMARNRHGLADSDGVPVTPLQASRGNAASKARLEGLIRFREQLAIRPVVTHLYSGYLFDRLRRRLGLETRDPAFVEVEELALLSERELESLDAKSLDDAKLAEAFESAAALGHDARTGRFAAELVERDSAALGGIDRHALFAVLVRRAIAEHDDELALKRLDQAVAVDAQHGGGHQRPIFQAWKAEYLTRIGEPDAASVVYREILSEAPPELAPELALDAAETLEDNEHFGQALIMARHALELAINQSNPRIESLVRAMLEELDG